jgi:hypothetical protein
VWSRLGAEHAVGFARPLCGRGWRGLSGMPGSSGPDTLEPGSASCFLCGVVLPFVFVVVLLIEGRTGLATTPSAIWAARSAPPGGWMQIVNFIARGLLIMMLTAALARSHPPTTNVTGQRYPMNFRPCRRPN